MRRLWMTLVVLFAALPCWGIDIIAASDAPADWKAAADATCDGTADDVEIQAALTAVAADGGGTVTLSPGNFAVSTVLLIDDNVTLAGQGNATILTYGAHAADATPVICNVDHAAGTNTGIVLRDFKIDGNAPNQVGWDTTYGEPSIGNRGAVHFRYVNDFKVLNLYVYQPYCAGIEMERCTYGVVRGNRVVDSMDDGIGINILCNNITVDDNHITDCAKTALYGGPSGVEVQDTASRITVANNAIYQSGTVNITSGIQVNDHFGDASHAVSITGNVLSSAADAALFYGVALVGNADHPVYNISVTGNTFLIAGASHRAITMAYAKSVTVTGNTVYSTGANYGLRASTLASNVTISNNVFDGSAASYGISAAQPGVYTNWVISENQFVNESMNTAISISSATSTYTNWLVRGNIFTGPNFAFRHNSDATVTNFRVVDNHIVPDSYIAYDDKVTAGDRQPAGWEVRGNSGGSALTQAFISNSFETIRNTSGGALTAGMIVVLKDDADGWEITTTTTPGDDKVVGVVADASIANNAFGRVQTTGKTVTLKVNGTQDIAIGDWLTTSGTAGVCEKAGGNRARCAIALEAYTGNDNNGVIDALITGAGQRRAGGVIIRRGD